MSTNETNVPTAQDVKPAPKTGFAAPNFTSEEDIFLCKAVVVVSTDPLVGNDQKGPVYWERVHGCFLSYIQNEAEVQIVGSYRTSTSLKNRFQRQIAKETKECNAVLRSNPIASRENDEKHLQRVSVAFFNRFRKHFRFLKCLPWLNKMPIFNMDIRSPLATLQGDEKEPPSNVAMATALTSLERPVGCKKAKREMRAVQDYGL
jgi:hypothetical protein